MNRKNILNIIKYTILISLLSCAPQKNIHGILISDFDIDNIITGTTNIDFFIDKYGEPTFKGAFNNNVYYKHETTKILPAGERKTQSRKILALEIDEKGIIISKNILNLDDGEEFSPALGKTETAGSDFTFFQQVFSNLRSGRFASTD